MKVLFYSTRKFEKEELEKSARGKIEAYFISDSLSPSTVSKAKGFDAISIFTGDDATGDQIKELDRLGVKYITTRAAGFDNIDLDTASELGVHVANVPAYSPNAIAEHAVALMMALNRKLIRARYQVARHDFRVDELVGFDLHKKTVGLIGTGKIGSVFARIMHGFGCKLLGYDIHQNQELMDGLGMEYCSLEELCKRSDVISLHTCYTPATKYLINAQRIKLMKKGVMIINTSRGGCVNTRDVMDGLESGKIGYFGTDVYENEKGIFFYDWQEKKLNDTLLLKLISMENVLVTPHQAFATKEAIRNITEGTFHNLDCWKRGITCETELTMVAGMEA